MIRYYLWVTSHQGGPGHNHLQKPCCSRWTCNTISCLFEMHDKYPARPPLWSSLCLIFHWFWQIWEDILGFENCEFYIKRWPQLEGMQFEDVLISFPDAIPCGIKVASCGGKIILNPDDSYVLQEGDEVLVIAEDDDSYAPTTLPMVNSFLLNKKLQ